MVMPEKTTLNLFNNALAELEQIVAELEVNENSDDSEEPDESLTEFEPNLIKPDLVNPPEKLIPQDDL